MGSAKSTRWQGFIQRREAMADATTKALSRSKQLLSARIRRSHSMTSNVPVAVPLTGEAGHDPWRNAATIVRLPHTAFGLQQAHGATVASPKIRNVLAARGGFRGSAVTCV